MLARLLYELWLGRKDPEEVKNTLIGFVAVLVVAYLIVWLFF